MRARERVALALRHQKPDRPPFNFWMDRRLMAQYAARFGADYRVTHFGADVTESFPGYERPIQIAHAAGLPVLMHSDGAVMSILDDVVALDFDGVNPLQPHLNNLSQFVARYGARLALYGGLDSCGLIPDGTPEQIRRHVQEVYQVAGQSGGLIFSTHDLPLGIPEANVWAMVDAIEALG